MCVIINPIPIVRDESQPPLTPWINEMRGVPREGERARVSRCGRYCGTGRGVERERCEYER